MLADGRFPSGGHAHSGGLEAAAALYGVKDVTTLTDFLRGRLATTGLVSAAFAAAACATLADTNHPPHPALVRLDQELGARTPSPVLRAVSRRLGRQLLRVSRTVWPHPHLNEQEALPAGGPYQPIALGMTAMVAGLRPHAAALATAHEAVLGPATAAVRLLGLDPFAVHAAVTALAPQIAEVADRATRTATAPPEDLPSMAGPPQEISAECHATWEVRLFAS
ncbi:urease accessory protein UreF [Streptomyces sp. NWU339]|uniref:urease accessory protein UreF n=1 Tax=Streptomyces sp. NWU339 TaxID=2185284 RepID=UPI000D68426A|nr:urease accessory UreF family protein [Streptomyces sp. NWU339]PWI06989.1 urease accessory protein UreF [Streptomyces sp. NWU339]